MPESKVKKLLDWLDAMCEQLAPDVKGEKEPDEVDAE